VSETDEKEGREGKRCEWTTLYRRREEGGSVQGSGTRFILTPGMSPSSGLRGGGRPPFHALKIEGLLRGFPSGWDKGEEEGDLCRASSKTWATHSATLWTSDGLREGAERSV
jgi:hypothetical protein